MFERQIPYLHTIYAAVDTNNFVDYSEEVDQICSGQAAGRMESGDGSKESRL